MISNIDATKPISGIDQPVKVIRDNFAFAKLEIEALQNNKVNILNGVLQLPIIVNVASLPDPAINQGGLAFVSSPAMVVFSDGTSWINLTTGVSV